MALHIYNTLTRKKEFFKPQSAEQVKFYCCGVTPYDHSHLGHGRSYVVWDTVRRYLEFSGYSVTYIQNFTDIDDKILKRAKETGSTMAEVANTFITSFHDDMKALNIRPATAFPRITTSMPQITDLIKELEEAGFAYPSSGDVYYHVRRFADYGKLSGKRLEQLEAGRSNRLDEDEVSRKQDPFDFALWKAAAEGEPAWESPWGRGRPGWHIECSAMLREHLGDTVDIHAGGEDLQFPHHENEIAQSEAVTGKPLAHWWMHNGFLNVVDSEGKVEKMSKSLGNFVTLRNLFQEYSPMALRLLVLNTIYRNPITFSLDILQANQNAWHTIEEALRFSEWIAKTLHQPLDGEVLPEEIERFKKGMDDDFNTPEALTVIFELTKRLLKEHNTVTHGGAMADPVSFARTWRTLKLLSEVLGLKAEPIEVKVMALSAKAIEAQILLREQARESRNWSEADRIRKYLAEKGITLIDHKGKPSTWIASSL
jgi:cysteinyl-tRNA synthetase